MDDVAPSFAWFEAAQRERALAQMALERGDDEARSYHAAEFRRLDKIWSLMREGEQNALRNKVAQARMVASMLPNR